MHTKLLGYSNYTLKLWPEADWTVCGTRVLLWQLFTMFCKGSLQQLSVVDIHLGHGVWEAVEQKRESGRPAHLEFQQQVVLRKAVLLQQQQVTPNLYVYNLYVSWPSKGWTYCTASWTPCPTTVWWDLWKELTSASEPVLETSPQLKAVISPMQHTESERLAI